MAEIEAGSEAGGWFVPPIYLEEVRRFEPLVLAVPAAEANRAAEKLLLAHCTRRQRREWTVEKALCVRSPAGRIYHISGHKRWENVHYVGGSEPLDFGRGACLCASPSYGGERLPIADVVLAQKLGLEHDDLPFLEIAGRITRIGSQWLERTSYRRKLEQLPRMETCRRPR